MKIHQRMGNIGEAVREYNDYCSRLKKELSVGPSRELKESYTSILKWAQQEGAEVVRIKDKAYNSDFAEMCIRDRYGTILSDLILLKESGDLR